MARFEDSRKEMTEEEFRLLRDLVYDHSGILVREEMKFVMERRLGVRLDALGLTDFAAYYRHLREGGKGGELETAVEALTTNETYFFREPLQLEALEEELFPLLEKRNQINKRLRFWSAGCSSGEEAYTVAMLLAESSRFAGWDLEVHGTDISRRVLTQARRAEYGPASFRVTSEARKRRHFEPGEGARLKVKEEHLARVSFSQLNLLDRDLAQLLPRMDVILCRNVMIYFDLPARKRVLGLFHEKLAEGGYLLLGHSENLISLSADFELVHLKKDLVYRKPERDRRGGKP